MLIDTKTTAWTHEEREIALAVLKKIGKCEDEGAMLGNIFEAFVAVKKNISTEAVIFDEESRIYLIQRPSLKQNPSEPYPEQWHAPGVTHGKNELLADTFARLVKREFGDAEIRRKSEVWPPPEVKDPVRGTYLLRIFVIETYGRPNNKRGCFFHIDRIQYSDLVKSHRDIVIPLALEHHRWLVESQIW